MIWKIEKIVKLIGKAGRKMEKVMLEGWSAL
jgi:hypothetical protein